MHGSGCGSNLISTSFAKTRPISYEYGYYTSEIFEGWPECCLGKENQGTIKWIETGTRGVAMKPMDIVLTQPGKLAWGIGRPHVRHSGVLVSGSADQMAAF
jgi:hypothetical protein